MRHLSILLFTTVLMKVAPVHAQSFLQAWSATGNAADGVTALNVNSQGDAIAAVIFGDVAVVNGDTLPYPGHVYLTRLSQDSVEWIVPAGISMNPYEVEPFDLVLDENDDIYLAGHLGPNTHVGDTLLNEPDIHNTFVAKFTSQGDLVWAKPAAMGVVAVGIDRDASGALIVGGATYGPQAVIGADTVPILGNQGGDIIMIKLDANGDLLWYDRSGGPGWYPDFCGDVAFDPAGDIFLTGYYRSESWFDTIPMVPLFPSNPHGFVAKYSSVGHAQWVIQLAYSPHSIATDAAGNAYVAGQTPLLVEDSSIVSGYAYAEHYLAKTDGMGNIQWVLLPNTNSFGTAWNSCTRADGTTYVVGLHRDSLSIGPFTTLAPGLNALMVYRADSDGTVEWMALEGNTGTTSDFRGRAVAYDDDCGLVIGGTFRFSDPWSSGTAALPAAASSDAFVLFLDACDLATEVPVIAPSGLRLHPNPATERIILSQEGGRAILIRDAAGRVVQQIPVTGAAQHIDVSSFARGCYIVEVVLANGGRSLGRFVKE